MTKVKRRSVKIMKRKCQGFQKLNQARLILVFWNFLFCRRFNVVAKSKKICNLTAFEVFKKSRSHLIGVHLTTSLNPQCKSFVKPIKKIYF